MRRTRRLWLTRYMITTTCKKYKKNKDEISSGCVTCIAPVTPRIDRWLPNKLTYQSIPSPKRSTPQIVRLPNSVPFFFDYILFFFFSWNFFTFQFNCILSPRTSPPLSIGFPSFPSSSSLFSLLFSSLDNIFIPQPPDASWIGITRPPFDQ